MNLEYVRECLSYDADTGAFAWKARPVSHFVSARVWAAWNTRYAGTSAGNHAARCRSVKLDGKHFKLHRVAWLLMTGAWPTQQVDHEDTNPHNNAWSNLRLATNQQNQYNCGLKSTNTSGFKGVCWDKQARKWRASIHHNRKSVFLGLHSSPEGAASAYAAAAKKYANEFARTS